MKHSFQHDLDFETLRKVADKAFDSYATKYTSYSPQISWIDDRRAKIGFSVKGINIKGELAIAKSTIAVSIEVPFVFRLFKKKAISIVNSELDSWIEKAKTGEY